MTEPEPAASRPYMPGYGLAGPEEGPGLLPWSWAVRQLTDAYRYWVVTVTPDGAPHAMPVWAVWLDASLWFSTGGRSRKARNLRREPRCTIHTDGADPVVLDGVAELVEDTDAVARMIEHYGRKYPELPPDPVCNPIVRVRPRKVIGLVEQEFTTSPTRWTF
jgi:PPOX class probable F420-dependent enzyme